MHKVAASSFTWSVGACTVNQHQLATLRAAVSRQAEASLRVRRLWGDTDEEYHRRANRTPKRNMDACRLADVDVYVLKRMYDYTGHLPRVIKDKPDHLTGKVIAYKDAEWKSALTQVLGHQGHKGRFSPWDWERQCGALFRLVNRHWKLVAVDRVLWRELRPQWLRYMLGGRVVNSRMGSL